MKKKILLLSLLFAFSLASCEAPENNGGNGGNETPPTNVDDTFTITWKNWNGTVLETDTNVKKGTMPTYDGATPTKAEDTENTYTFSGWTPTVTAAVADATYTATFTATPKPQTFTITWKNWNGTTLETDRNVAKGTMPSYDGATPTKQEDAQNTYTFTGWSPTVVAVTADATYTAQFRANPKPETYTITWVNWNGQVLETDTNVVRGTMPSYDGATPTKPEDENNRYTFSGWSPTVVAVTANATYTAQFSSTPKQKTYTITWANWNGSVLETDRNVPEGTIPTYDSETPERPEDEDYTYTFTGWSPDVVAAVADATYTAQFRATAKGGSEQPPEVNYFVNKKLVTTGVDTTMPGGAMAAAMFTNSFINLFTDSTFEIICIYNGQVQAILGSYLVAEDGNSAALTVSKLFDDSGYSTSIPASFTNLSITYSEGNYTFVLPDGSYTITFTLRDSGEEPEHYDLPNDPNAYGDPKYHVNKSTWDAIMSNHDLNKGDYNFTVSYTNILGGNSVLKVDNSKFEFVGDPSMYLERTGEDKYSIYNYDSNQQYWNVNSNVELGADYFDDSFGVLPIAFEDMSFGSESTYYYKSAYRYYPDKENDPTNYVDYSNIRVYFEDNKLQQISYVVMGSTKSFVYSAHNTTTVTLPTQTTPIDVTQYLPELQNKVFTFDSYSGSGEAAVMARVYAGSKVSIFNDYSAEFFLAHTYNGTDVLDVEICLFGGITLRENSYNANNGDPYIVGDFRATSMAYDGVPNSQTQTFSFRYFVNSKKVRVQVESGEYLFFNLSDQTPEHYEIETPVGAQWPSEAVSSYLTKIGSTSVVPPLEGALSYMNMESEGMLLVSCMFGSADAMNAAYATYTTTLLRTFEYNQTYQWYFDAQIVIMLQKNADANSISVVIMENPFPTPASGYPETEINAFITNNSITDSVPDFRYENAIFMTLQATDTSYSFMVTPPNGVTSATLFGYYNNMLNASESFTLISQGENGYVYVSATSQYYVIIADNEGTVLVNLVYNDSPYIYYYPADKISSFFTGVTDQYYDFSIKSAVAYSFEAADEEADLNYAVLNIYFDEEDVESVAAGYIGGLQTLGYGLKTGETYGEMYVSPNKEIGFAFEVYESGISIRLYNLKKHSDNFTVNYTLYNTNDWNIYDANPQFYAWVFGGKYGMGEWIELNQVTDEEGHKYFTLEGIDDNATGMNIVRFAADSEIGWGNEEGVRIFNQTSNISLTSNNTVISFSFNG